MLSFILLFTMQAQGLLTFCGKKPESNKRLLYYFLPRTVIRVDVVVTEKNILAGPYAEFTEEMLGIKGASVLDKYEWTLDSIGIIGFSEPDPSAIYAVQIRNNEWLNSFLKLSKAGLLFEPSARIDSSNNTSYRNDLMFTQIAEEYSMQSFVSESFDTLYKTILKDSLYIKLPVLKPKIAAKTMHERAKEASDVIFKIRQRKFELILSEDEAFPEEKVLKHALGELQKLENSYLQLFTGKIVSKQRTVSYFYIPELDSVIKERELFYFSKQKGILNRLDENTEPIVLGIKTDGRADGVKSWLNSLPTDNKKLLIYRIPESANVSLKKSGQLIVSKKLLISQLGVAVPFVLE